MTAQMGHGALLEVRVPSGSDQVCRFVALRRSSTCFATTSLGRWRIAEVSLHGFGIRYESGQQSAVGYANETSLGMPAARTC